MTSLAPAAAGLATGLSLIVAIGSQNAFVLRQGLTRTHVGAVVLVCALSDLVLIGAGVAGVGTVVEQAPVAIDVVRWAGVAFLTAYAVLSFRRAARGGESLGPTGAPVTAALAAVVAQALALTWLNPHVYLDTVLLLGSLANQHGSSGRWVFALGAGIGSIVWFTALGYGARALTPLFARPTSWRVLDGVIGLTMVGIAVGLAAG